MNDGAAIDRAVPAPTAHPLAALIALAAAALFFAGALFAALSYGALPALLQQAGNNQVIYFCH